MSTGVQDNGTQDAPSIVDPATPVDLAEVIGDEPAAVLLVDLVTRQVVHSNPVADQLAPHTSLPVALDAWSDAAMLSDADGAALSDTDHPLSRVARSEPVLGLAVSAARSSEMGRRREPLWMVALPMTGAPMLDQHALVVFLPLRDVGSREAVTAAAAAAQESLELRDRAVVATGLSFTVADARAAGQPLVWVNPAFTRTTGYSFDDVVGHNCRFLQGRDTDPAAPAEIRAALDRGEAVTTTLLNYRKDGTPFWNQVDLSPIHGPDGDLTHFVGIQTDVSNRVDADRARDLALAAEKVARAEAEAAQARLRFMVEAVNRLSGALDVAGCRRRLIELVLPELADWVLVLHVDDRGAITEVDGAHRDPARTHLVQQLGRDLPDGLHRGTVDDLFLQGQEVRTISDLDQPSSHGARSTYLRDPRLAEQTAHIGSRSAMYVALPGRRDVDDLMVLLRGPDRPPFTDADLDVGRDLGRRVGLILDNVRLYEVQANIAETLQRSLLPDLPPIEGMTVAARYQASAVGAEVGGDFYEILDLPDGSVGVAVGDVIGHDVIAAAAMGHLKGLLRACAYEGATSPARVLERVDHLITGLGMPTMATAVYAQLRADGPGSDDRGWRLTWSNAGHPPPVVRLPDGSVELLTTVGPNDTLLGLGVGERASHERGIPAGSTLVGYTDGLVERRGETIDDGLARLLDAVRTGPDDVHALCDHLIAELGANADDDTAVIALCLGDPPA